MAMNPRFYILRDSIWLEHLVINHKFWLADMFMRLFPSYTFDMRKIYSYNDVETIKFAIRHGGEVSLGMLEDYYNKALCAPLDLRKPFFDIIDLMIEAMKDTPTFVLSILYKINYEEKIKEFFAIGKGFLMFFPALGCRKEFIQELFTKYPHSPHLIWGDHGNYKLYCGFNFDTFSFLLDKFVDLFIRFPYEIKEVYYYFCSTENLRPLMHLIERYPELDVHWNEEPLMRITYIDPTFDEHHLRTANHLLRVAPRIRRSTIIPATYGPIKI